MKQIFRPQPGQRGYFPPAGPAAPIIMAATTVLSTGLSIAQQSQQASAQAGMANYQAQVARNNQMVAEWNARRALQQGQVDEQNQRLKSASLLGSQRAALASQGGDVNSGSPLDIQADTARAGEYDAQTIRNNAALKAYGYRVQAANTGAEANLDDFKAGNAMASLPYGIGSSLLGGAKSLAGTFSSPAGGGGGVSVNYTSGNAAAGFGTYAPSNAFGWS
ncbi:MAG TPA: hypothetical protein VGM96_31405 [Reyranella sp.]|jgi:hypothetical protein